MLAIDMAEAEKPETAAQYLGPSGPLFLKFDARTLHLGQERATTGAAGFKFGVSILAMRGI